LRSQNFKNNILKFQTGSAQQNVGPSHIKKLSIPLPQISTQNQLVVELDGYQKIIDGCRQVIENYKPSIDIDPSWEMIELGQLCSLMTGGTPKTDNKEFYENGDVPWLVSGDIHKVEIYNSKKFITKKGMESSSAKFLPVNSVLIALNGQGKTRGTVAVLRMKATCNQSIVSIKPNDEDILKTEFLYLYLNSIYKNIRNLTGDNQRSGLNMPIIREIKIPLAPIEEQIKFINIWNSEKNMINVNSKTIDDFQKKIQSKIEKIWSN
jgi:restriction endonuclease S subunit